MTIELPLNEPALRIMHVAAAQAEMLRLPEVDPEQVGLALTLLDSIASETLDGLGEEYRPRLQRAYMDLVIPGDVPSAGYTGRYIPRSNATIVLIQDANNSALRYHDRPNNAIGPGDLLHGWTYQPDGSISMQMLERAELSIEAIRARITPEDARTTKR